jgi:hypothetical protein
MYVPKHRLAYNSPNVITILNAAGCGDGIKDSLANGTVAERKFMSPIIRHKRKPVVSLTQIIVTMAAGVFIAGLIFMYLNIRMFVTW